MISLVKTAHRSRALQAKVIIPEVIARVEELLVYHGQVWTSYLQHGHLLLLLLSFFVVVFIISMINFES